MAVQPSKNNFFAVVPAAGIGRRMAADLPKQYLLLLGKTVLELTLEKLLSISELQRIIVTTSQGDDRWRDLSVMQDSRVEVVDGGQERSHSVLNGLQHLSQYTLADDWVLVHDVARPCVALEDINRLMSILSDEPVGGILATPVSDTIKKVVDNNEIVTTVDRQLLWRAQTPQMFRFQLLLESLSSGIERGLHITDEASAIELAGFKPKIIESKHANIKITVPEDLRLAEYYLHGKH
jgi:2-C-methyl-D-erythritol 4-phosphate cytidylyltransferase